VAAGRVALTVRTEASPEYVRQLAAYLEDRVAELSRGGVKDTLAALTLAALDITDELFRAREDKARQDGDVHTRLGALVEMLERLTPAPRPPSP
jgi:cell division protein ZapA (FtsZ GTPase activity inhibitor)